MNLNRRAVRLRSFLVILLVALFSGTAIAEGCYTAPYSCHSFGDINPATPGTYADRYQAYANFAWQDFLALNFPTATDATGKPLPEPSTVHGLDYNGGDYPAVWEVYPEARDIFQPGAVPPAEPFGSGHEIPALCLARGQGAHLKVFRRAGRALGDEMVLDEYIQANRMGPVIDKAGAYVRYGINFNRPMFNYIINNHLYSEEGQLVHDRDNPDRDKNTVRFPPGSYSGGTSANVGSIFVKSSWKILGASDDPSTFYRVQAYIYEAKGGVFEDEPTVHEQCEVKTVGLVGLHIVHLTDSAPQWVWATFEHASNAPWLADFTTGSPTGQYSFFDPATCSSVGGRPGCVYDVLPPQPWNPQLAGQPPTQLIRIAAPGQHAIEANRFYNGQLQQHYGDTVWKHYFLVDVQFPTVVAGTRGGTGRAVLNPAYPDGVPTPSFLANSTMETFIEGFHAGEHTTNGNAIPTTDQMQNIVVTAPPVNPFVPNVYNRAGGSERLTSSCVSCHGDAAMTTGSNGNFVFSLDRAHHAERRSPGAQLQPGDRALIEKVHKYMAKLQPPDAQAVAATYPLGQ